MNANWKRAMLASLILIFSSLAGCLGNDTDNDETVMVSTYHIGELVKAIAGDDVAIEYMSLDNIPAHDYEPSASDIIRLKNADVFFYHGLGLEPWVEATLSSLGSDAPTSIQVHTMPTGQDTLDYEGVLVADLCETLSEGPYEVIELADEEEHADDVEIHAEYTAFNMEFHEEDHDGHGDEEDHDEDEHDGHDEDGHDDHDDHDGEHEGHAHIEAEETIANPVGCPADSMISIIHLEEGEYVLEFAAEHPENFTMAVLKMGGGGHDDHAGHGDEDGHDEEEDGHDEEEDGHDEHDEEMTAEHMLEAFDSNNDSHLSWDELWAGMDADHEDNETHDENETHDDDEHMEENLMWMFNQSDMDADGLLDMAEIGQLIEMMESDMPTPEQALIMADANDDGHLSWDEFWNTWSEDEEDHDEHHEENETHEDEEAHDEHDAHDEHEEEMLMEMFNESDMDGDGLLNLTELEHFIEDLDAWQNPPMGYVTLHVEAEGEYGFAHPTDLEFHVVMAGDGHEGHDGHDDHGEEDGHDEEEDGHDEEEDGHDEEEDGHDEEEDGHDEHDDENLNYDPHSWLSPLAFKAQVTVVMDGLIAAFPDGEADFKANADAYSAQLTALDVAFDAAFGADGICMAGGYDKTVAANHNAYSYIAVEYDIKFMTVHGLDPEGEPSPEDVAKVVDFIKEEGITVLFVEEYTDQSSVQSIVDETGVEIKTLYTMELAPSDSTDDYLSMMTKNLENLVSGIGC